MLLHWKPSCSTSALHAAHRTFFDLPLVDANVGNALAEPVAGLRDEVTAAGLAADAFWAYVLPYSAQIENNTELARRTLTRIVGATSAEGLVSRFAGRIADLDAAFGRAVPDVAAQLPLRADPIREQWESRGPGLLASITRLTEPTILVEEATVILVHPVAGGAGGANTAFNSVYFEAVLTNPLPQLPEVVRLGWLLSQLNLDLPNGIDWLTIAQVIPLAMLPPTLAAAEEVELTRLDPATLQLALCEWYGQDAEQATATAGQLLAWWETYQTSRPRFEVALAALGQALA